VISFFSFFLPSLVGSVGSRRTNPFFFFFFFSGVGRLDFKENPLFFFFFPFFFLGAREAQSCEQYPPPPSLLPLSPLGRREGEDLSFFFLRRFRKTRSRGNGRAFFPPIPHGRPGVEDPLLFFLFPVSAANRRTVVDFSPFFLPHSRCFLKLRGGEKKPIFLFSFSFPTRRQGQPGSGLSPSLLFFSSSFRFTTRTREEGGFSPPPFSFR